MLAVGIIIAAGIVVGAAPAGAADVSFEPSTANQSPGSLVITGFGASDMLLVGVSLNGAPAGTTFEFGVTAGLTPSYGYTFTSGMQEVSFSGSTANANAALATMLVATGAAEGEFTLEVTATLAAANTYFLPTTGDYYRYVAQGGVTWTDARAGALALTYNGATGYLTNITSAGENTFVSSKVNASNVWIGGSDSAAEGVWRWMDGPEAGTQFWQGTNTGSATAPYNYASWASGEPNNTGTSEHYTATNWRGTRGQWNDLRDSGVGGPAAGYLVEFSPPVGGFTGVTTILRTAIVGTPAPAPPPVPIWTLTYEPNGGSCTVMSGSGPDTSWLATPGASACTRSDYQFIGWNTAANGTGIGFTPGAQAHLSGDNALYAQWVPIAASTSTPSPSASTGEPTGSIPVTSARRTASRVVFFDSGSSVLTDQAKARLRALVAENGTGAISVTSIGYVQESGTKANDLTLSMARATSVSAYLRSLGLRGTYREEGKGIAGPAAADRRARVTVFYLSS